jgi:hypothetical protein
LRLRSTSRLADVRPLLIPCSRTARRRGPSSKHVQLQGLCAKLELHVGIMFAANTVFQRRSSYPATISALRGLVVSAHPSRRDRSLTFSAYASSEVQRCNFKLPTCSLHGSQTSEDRVPDLGLPNWSPNAAPNASHYSIRRSMAVSRPEY